MESAQYLFDLAAQVADVVSLFAFVWAGVAAVLLWQKRRDYVNRLKTMTKMGERPVALAIGRGGSIEGAVGEFLRSAGMNMEIISISKSGMVPRDQFINVLEEVRGVKNRLTDAGCTEVHLFYKGPVVFATALGAVVDNWVPTKVYDFDGGKYALSFEVNKAFVLGR